MDMHLSGLTVPKLGSLQDRTIRSYMTKKVGREIAATKLLAQVASAAGGGDKKWERAVANIWNDYLRATYYLEAEQENLEQDMLAEYKKFAHIRPTLVIEKDGTMAVKGVPKSVL